MPSLHHTEPELTTAAAADAAALEQKVVPEQTVAPAAPKRSLKANLKSRVRLAHEHEAQSAALATTPAATAPAVAASAVAALTPEPAIAAQPTQPPSLVSRKLPQSLKKRLRGNKA